MFIDFIARGEEKENLTGLRRPLSAPLRKFDTLAAAIGGGSQAYRWLETPPRGSLSGVLNSGVTRAGPDLAPNLTVLSPTPLRVPYLASFSVPSWHPGIGQVGSRVP